LIAKNQYFTLSDDKIEVSEVNVAKTRRLIIWRQSTSWLFDKF